MGSTGTRGRRTWAWRARAIAALGIGGVATLIAGAGAVAVPTLDLPPPAPPLPACVLAGGVGVSANWGTSMAVKADGTLWGWGRSGIVPVRPFARRVAGLTNVVEVANGFFDTVALKGDGTVWTVGRWWAADGDVLTSPPPTQVTGLTAAVAVASGLDYSLALESDGTVWAWGSNQWGQLGDGTHTNRTTPVQVSGLTGITAISAGNSHSLALRNDGTVWTWGANWYGQLGDGTTTDQATPLQVGGLTGITAVAAGWAHSLAVDSNGDAWSWGGNWGGQLGDGTRTSRSTPVNVSGSTGLVDVVSVAGGESHSLAIDADGMAWAWGRNVSGELGDGTTTLRSSPVPVTRLAGVASVAAGFAHSLALGADGRAWVWGENSNGELGDSTLVDRHSPVPVADFSTVPCVADTGVVYGEPAVVDVVDDESGLPSSDCEAAGGHEIVDRAVGDLHTKVYVASGSSPSSVDVCLRIEDGSGDGVGGKLTVTSAVPDVRVDATGLPTIDVPQRDGEGGACTGTTDPPNQVPGSHPMVSTTIAGTPVAVDAHTGSGNSLWVCLQAGDSVNERLIVLMPPSWTQIGPPAVSVTPAVVVTFRPDPGTLP